MVRAESDLDRIVGWGLASNPATVAKAMWELYTTDLRVSVAAIRVPTLVLGGLDPGSIRPALRA
ncbi:MAG TPA: hypothetical protein VGL42_02485 [Opitutaceae bacterium]|jgi:pimeloyl-ACP methyl ester carboxylesterase